MKWFESLVQLPTRCEKSFATDVPHSVDPCSVSVLKLVHGDMASFISIHTLQRERKKYYIVIIKQLKHHWSLSFISLETSELRQQALTLCWDAQRSWERILYCFCALPYWQRTLVTEFRFKFCFSHTIIQDMITVKCVTLNKEWATEQSRLHQETTMTHPTVEAQSLKCKPEYTGRFNVVICRYLTHMFLHSTG